MTQSNNLIRLSDVSSDATYNIKGEGVYDPTGHTAYGINGEKIGTIRDALVDPTTGKIRYFLVDVGGWFSSKEVLVPVGQSRIDDNGVYFDTLTKDQVSAMSEYKVGQAYTHENTLADERVLLGVQKDAPIAPEMREKAYRTPDRLQLLEERLVVNKDRFVAGSVEIGKHVETHTENVSVPLQREEVVIERRPVTDARPVEGAVLGADNATMHVDLEAERANVSKQAYVTEEIGIGKRAVTETQTVTETVGREVLDVNKTGEVRLETDAAGTAQDTTKKI